MNTVALSCYVILRNISEIQVSAIKISTFTNLRRFTNGVLYNSTNRLQIKTKYIYTCHNHDFINTYTKFLRFKNGVL